MTLMDGHFPRIQPLSVFALLLPILQYQNSLNIAICSRIVKKSIHARVNFIQFASVFQQLHKAIIVVVPDSYHRRSFLIFVMRSVRKHLFFEYKIHDINVPSARQKMKDVSFVLGQGPKIHIRIIYQQLNTLNIILKNGIVKSCKPLLTFEVDVVRISHLLQNILHIVEHTLIASQHQRSFLLPIKIFQISTVLH